MSEHRSSDEPGGDDGHVLSDSEDEEHPLEGGQGDAVDDAQERQSDGSEDDLFPSRNDARPRPD